MKKHTILRNAGFMGQQHFYNLSGINHAYQSKLLDNDKSFFISIVYGYKPLIYCKKRIDDFITIETSLEDREIMVEITCRRSQYINILFKIGVDIENIKLAILNDIPEKNETIESQSTNTVDFYDKFPEGEK